MADAPVPYDDDLEGLFDFVGDIHRLMTRFTQLLAMEVGADYRSLQRRAEADVERRERFHCDACEEPITGLFMIHDDLWAAVAANDPDMLLCAGCVEERLGRRLERADFKPGVPCNEEWL